MIDGKILMELVPGTGAEEILASVEDITVVELTVNRSSFEPKLALLTTPRAIAKELLKKESLFFIAQTPSTGMKGFEISLFYEGKKIARTAPENVQPRTWYEIKGRGLRALYQDWDCLNQIFGKE